MKSTFSIIFYLKRLVVKKDGTLTILFQNIFQAKIALCLMEAFFKYLHSLQ